MQHHANGSYDTTFDQLDIDLPAGKTNSSTDNIYFYNWGTCQLGPSETYCTLSINRKSLYFLRGYASEGRYCRAYTDAEGTVAEKVCLSLGGTNKTTSTSLKYVQYTLP